MGFKIIIKFIEKLAIKVVPETKKEAEKKIFLDERLLNTPTLAISECFTKTIEMAEVLLNKNSLDFLNMAKSDKYESVYETIQLYKQQIEKYNLKTDSFKHDSSGIFGFVMELIL